MAVDAHETVPVRLYRRTQPTSPGRYFKRPKLTAAKLVAKLRRLANPHTRDVWLIMQHKRHPDYILLVSYSRGTDPMTRERYEIKGYALVPPDMRLRAVASPPGYTGGAKGQS